MRWTRRALTISLTLLALTSQSQAEKVKWCFLCEIQETAPVETFCALYSRQILNSSDSVSVKALPLDLQRRLVKNDTIYRCKCQKWQNPICGSAPQ